MFTTIAIIGLIFLALEVRHLASEVKTIKKQLKISEATPAQTPVPQSPFINTSTVTPTDISSVSSQPDHANVFIEWLKENWLLKLGVLLILVGFGWFISYAFIYGWIGPVGRIVLGFVVGSVLAVFGSMRMEKNSTQGKLFLILGSALVIITSFSARTVYDFFTPTIALGIVFLVSAYVSTVALQFKNKNIAIYGLVIAFLAPILTDSNIDAKLLFSYLIVVSLASIWLASVKGWRDINAIALFGFSLFAMPFVTEITRVNSTDKTFVLASIFLIGFVYFIVSIAGAIKNQENADSSDIFVAVIDSILILLTTITFIPEEMQSLVLAMWMIIFAVGSFMAFNYTKKEKFFYVYSLISILLLATATSIELKGSSLIYAYAFESAIISIAGYLITRKLNVGYKLSTFMIVPIFMALPSLDSYKWNTGIFHDDFGILVVVGLLTFGMGLFYYFSEKESAKYKDHSDKKIYVSQIIVGSIFFLAIIWLSSGALVANYDVAVMISLAIYTIIGIATYFYGLTESKKAFKYYGGALLILVVARLVLIDVWDMALAQRIVTFLLIGVLFISTAFIGNKVKHELPKNN